jgi:hypothetical protein
MKAKKFIAFVALFTLLASAAIPLGIFAAPVEYGAELQNAPEKEYPEKFSDVPKNYWAFPYIAELTDLGIINGYPDGLFRPENNVQRSEFAKLMISAAGLKAAAVSETSFDDVSANAWYAPFIEAAKAYLTGYNMDGKNMYLPETVALREDITVALVKLKAYDTSIADLGMLQAMFSDYESISSALRPYVAVAVSSGLVSGYPDGTFRGQAGITRAEAATLLWRARQYGFDNKGTDPSTVPAPQMTPAPASTPQPAASPNVTPAPEPTMPPTETSAPEPNKAYRVETLATTEYLQDADMLTYDNNGNIYYEENNKVVKVNIASKTRMEILDMKTLIIDNNNMVCVDFHPISLFYSTQSNRLLLQGGFGRVEGENPIGYAVYAVGDSSAEFVTALPNSSKKVVDQLPSGDFINFDGNYRIYSMASGFLKESDINCLGSIKDDPRTGVVSYYSPGSDGPRNHILVRQFGNTANVFAIAYDNYGPQSRPVLQYYKYSNNQLVQQLAGKECIDATAIGANAQNIYLYNDSDSTWSVYDMNGNKVKSFDASDMDIKDMRPINLRFAKLIISDGNIIFYDSNGQLRIISENK